MSMMTGCYLIHYHRCDHNRHSIQWNYSPMSLCFPILSSLPWFYHRQAISLRRLSFYSLMLGIIWFSLAQVSLLVRCTKIMLSFLSWLGYMLVLTEILVN